MTSTAATAPSDWLHDPGHWDWQPRPPPHINDEQTTHHGDRLATPRPCKQCGRTVRQLHEKSHRTVNLTVLLEGPVDPPTVAYPDDRSFWWHHGTGAITRVGLPKYDERHLALGHHLFVLHHCSLRQPEGTTSTMTAPTFGTFVPPAFEEGDTYSAKDHIGANIIVKVNEYKTGIVTPNSPDGGPGVIVDLVDLGDGKLYRNVLFMGGAFVDGLKDWVGKEPVVLTIVSKTGKSGRAYAAPEAGPVALAQAYWAAQGDPFMPTFNAPTPEAAPAPAAAPAAAAPPWAAQQ